MEKFDIKTATFADLYAARQYCSDSAAMFRKVATDKAWEEAKIYIHLSANISAEIHDRLSPSIEEIKKKLSE